MLLGSVPILLGIPFLHALQPQIDGANHAILPPVSTSTALPTINAVLLDPPLIPEQYQSYSNVFVKQKADKLPPHRSFNHRIPLNKGKVPPFGPIYSLSQTGQTALKEYLDKNLSKEFIVPSESPAALPILFVKKKDGSL